jgi:hypothetical protein
MNKLFKHHLKQLYHAWFFGGNHALALAKRIKPHVILLCQLNIMAWQCISPDMIVKEFKKCCISNAMDESYDVLLWNNSKKGGNVRSMMMMMMMTSAVMTETLTLTGKSGYNLTRFVY